MMKITLNIDGMMCGVCESHVNDAVRKAFPVKKIASQQRRDGDPDGDGYLRAAASHSH